MKQQQSGFTLIELIMVIVILGILSAFALPKFANLTADAEEAALAGARAAVKSANAIVHSKALVKGQTAATGSVTMEGGSVAVVYGYPKSSNICSVAGVTADFTCTAVGTDMAVQKKGGALKVGEKCFKFTPASAAAGVVTVPVVSDIVTVATANKCPS